MIRIVLVRFLESYFRHRWLNILPIFLLILAGVFYQTVEKPKYVAKGILFVQQESFLASLTSVRNSDATWWATPAQTITKEISEIIMTDSFIRAIIHDTPLEERMDEGPEVVAEIINTTREDIWVTTLGDNQLQINAAAENPQTAQKMVSSVIEGYIQWKVNAQRTDSEVAQSFFAEQIKIYESQLETARQALIDYLTEHPMPLRGERVEVEDLEISRLQSDVDLASTRYVDALGKEESARLALAQIESDTRQTYVVIDAPNLPEKPDRSLKQMAIQIVIFTVAGFILSFGAIAGNMLIDRSFRFPFDVQQTLNLPVLAVLPDLTPERRWHQRIFQKIQSIKRKTEKPAAQEAVVILAAVEAEASQPEENHLAEQQQAADALQAEQDLTETETLSVEQEMTIKTAA